MVAERDFACNVTTKFVGAHASQYQGLSRMDVSVGQQLTDPVEVGRSYHQSGKRGVYPRPTLGVRFHLQSLPPHHVEPH